MNVGRAEVVDENAMWAALQEDEGRRLAFGSDVWWTESGVVQKPKPEPEPELEPEPEPEPEPAAEPTVTTTHNPTPTAAQMLAEACAKELRR